ncbi:MAG TPA: NAD+ synthase [Phycisphaerae bacterium]|nr:NAD+ synthase [Phycisphaerae bacterium]
MKIALGQINPVVGDIAGNSEKIIEWAGGARKQGAELILFPELAVIGYPPKDLLLKPQFVRANEAAVADIAARVRGIDVLVGYAARNESGRGRALYNAAALLRGGSVVDVSYKSLLPTYDVFDESRYFEPAREPSVVTCGRRRLGVTICEDLWNDESFIGRRLYPEDPIGQLVKAGADLLVNASASPFEIDKHGLRERLFSGQVARCGVPLAFCNQVGGNDELIFDGASCVFDASGRVIARAKAFAEDLLIVSLAEPTASRLEPYPGRIERLFSALTLGTRDYVSKCGFAEVVVGLSGGIDSAVTAALATSALGADAVHGVSMPSRYTSSSSTRSAEQLASRLGISFDVIEIEPLHRTFERQLSPHFAGREPDIAEENIQARIRGTLLMALSNKFGWLTLATGNKSELSTGYCTLYGDMVGGLAVLGDVPKTMVYALAEHVNSRGGSEVIPQETIQRAPTAELRPDQHDQQSLPPYDMLDSILHRYVEQDQSIDQMVAEGMERGVVERVVRMVDSTEYKRKQAAPVLKVTGRAFGSGRRLPIAARYRIGPFG